MFGHDSSRDSITIYKFLEYGEIIYRGPVFSVIWGYLSPIYYYMILPSHFLFGFHPLSSAILSNILGLIFVVFATFLSYKLFDKKTSIVISIIAASSVLLIRNSGSALNPSLMPPFVLLLYYSIVKFLNGESRYLIGIAISMSFLLSLHPSGIFFVPVLIILAFFKKSKLDKKSTIISAVIVLIVLVLPYLIQEKKLAWWTIKKTIEYIGNNQGTNPGFVERIIFFVDAVFKNTSIFLFGDTIKNYTFYTMPLYVYLLYDFAKSVFGFRVLTSRSILTILLVLYLFFFMIAVPFEDNDINRQWFGACFIPLLVLYFGVVLSKLVSKKYNYAGNFILAGFVIINIVSIYNFRGLSDSYFHKKEIANFLREDSSGVDFDIFGSNPEPFFYTMWYNETDSSKKEMYRTWFFWAKERDAKLAYVITDKKDEDLDLNSLGKYTDKKDVYVTSLQYRIIKFTKP